MVGMRSSGWRARIGQRGSKNYSTFPDIAFWGIIQNTSTSFSIVGLVHALDCQNLSGGARELALFCRQG
jgi:hypothetical protein